MGPICLIIDDEGAISCLGWQEKDRDALPAEEWEMSPCVGLIPVGFSHSFDPCFHLITVSSSSHSNLHFSYKHLFRTI